MKKNILIEVVDRHLVRFVMDTKLHATDNCSLTGRVEVGFTGLVVMGVRIGALVNAMMGRMVGSTVGVSVMTVGDIDGTFDSVRLGKLLTLTLIDAKTR